MPADNDSSRRKRMMDAIKGKPKVPPSKSPKVATVATDSKDRAKSGGKNPDKVAGAKVATVATLNPRLGPNPRVTNPRSAKARDIRAQKRGRLPIGSIWTCEWDGREMIAVLRVHTVPPGIDGYKGGDIVNDQEWAEAMVPKIVKEFRYETDGLFRAMEELDILFWDWYARAGDAANEALKALLVFAPNPPAPAAWRPPEGAAGTAPVAP